MEGRGFSRRVTRGNLDAFRPLLGVPKADSGSPPDSEATRRSDLEDPELAEAERLFAGTPLKIKMPFAAPKRARGTGRKKKRRKKSTDPGPKGPVLWRKKLVASDVQRQQGHPTGGVRLTQAGFRDPSGDLIVHTTYFRNLFDGYRWHEVGADPLVEGTRIPFEVTINGKPQGLHRLAVRYKPSGEADQGNQTSDLKWGELGALVKKMNLTGKTLTLYGPPPGQSSPYFIEIT